MRPLLATVPNHSHPLSLNLPDISILIIPPKSYHHFYYLLTIDQSLPGKPTFSSQKAREMSYLDFGEHLTIDSTRVPVPENYLQMPGAHSTEHLRSFREISRFLEGLKHLRKLTVRPKVSYRTQNCFRLGRTDRNDNSSMVINKSISNFTGQD